MAQLDPFSRHLDQPLPTLLRRLASVLTDLAQTHLELAHVMVEKDRAKCVAYGQGATSVRALEINADMASSSANQDVITLKGQIAALQEEKQFLLLLIDHARMSNGSA